MSEDLALKQMATDIVCAYVSNNKLESIDELCWLVSKVADSMVGGKEEASVLVPAVPINRSIKPGYIVCLEDGKKFKSLKRHLKNDYGLTPDEYRKKWGLASDYPMVCPNYAEARSNLAKSMGFGKITNKRSKA